MINKFFIYIARFKVIFSSASFYISVLNFALILATFKKTYNIPISAYVIIPLGLISLLIIGLVDYIFILRKQSAMINKKNNIKSQLDRVEKKIDKLINS